MKIIQIPRRFEVTAWGGTETVIMETARLLRSQGHETSILCPNALATKDHEQINGVPVHRVPYFYPYVGLSKDAVKSLDQQGGNLFSFSLIKTLFKEPGLDVIHLHTGKRLGGSARIVAKLKGIPYIVSLHGGFLDVPKEESVRYTAPTKGTFEYGRALGWLVGSRRLLNDAAAIVCVGKKEQAQLQKRFPNKEIVHLPNGVDINRFKTGNGNRFRNTYRIRNNAFLITIVGRIDPQKNQLLALNVLSRMRANGINAHLSLVGATTNNDYMNALRQFIARQGIGEYVTFTGNLNPDDIPSAYHASDLVMLPSVHEPFGIAVLEAWASGSPVLASAVGGIPDLIQHNENGMLFSSGNTEEATDLALRIYRNREIREKLSLAGQKSVEMHSWEHIAARLVRLYRQVILQAQTKRRKKLCVLE